MTDTKAAVMIGSMKGAAFNVGAGVKQGDALSAVLFNLALNYAVERLNLSGSIVYSLKQVSAYADDIALVARNMNALTEMFLDLERERKKIGLTVNVSKTKYLKISQGGTRIATDGIKIWPHKFEEVSEFKYLGTTLNSGNSISNEIHNRIMAGNRAYFSHALLLKSKMLSRQN